MTASRDPDRLIHAFLLEGEEELQDQVYDAVRAEIDQTRQRVIFAPWRTPIMNRIVGFGLGAAAVVVALVVGSGLLASPEPSGFGGPPSNEPTATAEPSAAEPTASEASPSADGSLSEGPHILWEEDDGGRSITVTIPAPGWYGEPGAGILENSGLQNFGPGDAGMIGPFTGDIYVPEDPCQWSTTMPDDPATTVDEVVSALQSQASREAEEPVDVTVGGHAGTSITLHVPDGAEFDDCDQGEFCSFTEDMATVCHRYQQFPGQIDELWILDVNGQVVVIDATWGETTPAADVAELRAILDSMVFETS